MAFKIHEFYEAYLLIFLGKFKQHLGQRRIDCLIIEYLAKLSSIYASIGLPKKLPIPVIRRLHYYIR